jgi:hypothetical protein
MREHLKSEVETWRRWAEPRGIVTPTRDDVIRFYTDVLPGKSMPVRQTLSTSLREHFGGAFDEVKLPYPLLTRYVGVTLAEVLAEADRWPPPQRSWVYAVALLRLKRDEANEWTGAVGPVEGIVRLSTRSVPVTTKAWRALSVAAEAPEAWPWSVADMHASLAVATASLPEITRASVWGRWSAMRVRYADQPRWLFGLPLTLRMPRVS